MDVRRAAAKVLAALTTALALVAVLGVPAQASPPAKIERYLFLSNNPQRDGGYATLVSPSRRIYLAQDTYRWVEHWTLSKQSEVNIFLAAGYYRWNCEVWPNSQGSNWYNSRCWLNRESNNSYAYTPTIAFNADSSASYNSMTGQYFNWMSTLTRL
ncbi:hypothetical protein [Micromonospora sp. NPDC126480]|uniref:hypothetical protein n=1 Tax=Micromonospora sp. NPDC126480 TaxID=3155312 RepID=UPI003328E2E9